MSDFDDVLHDFDDVDDVLVGDSRAEEACPSLRSLLRRDPSSIVFGAPFQWMMWFFMSRQSRDVWM